MAGTFLRTLLKIFTGLLFARRCGICRAVFNEGPSNWICPDCRIGISPELGPGCKICGRPFSLDYDAPAYLCGDCLRSPPSYDFSRSFGRYDGALRDLIHEFKYGNHPGLAPDLGGLLIELVRKIEFPGDFETIFSVPPHRERLGSRGFDPAFLLAKVLAEEFHVPLSVNCLVKTRKTHPQASLSRKERLKNIRGAFSWEGDPGRIKNKKILLVDDVHTTGETLRECASVLKRNGAERVYCLTVARA